MEPTSPVTEQPIRSEVLPAEPQIVTAPTPSNVQENNSKVILTSVIVILLLAAVGAGAYLFGVNQSANPAPIITSNGEVGCTMEAKMCPDGSSVGRSGPNCEFEECPADSESSSADINSIGKWETYTSSDFSFKYPPEIVLEEKQTNYIVLTDANDPQSILISIDARKSGRYATYTDAVAQTMKDLTAVETKEISNGIKISGLVGPGYGESQQIHMVLFKSGTAAIEAETTTRDESQLETFNQVISTFEIINN